MDIDKLSQLGEGKTLEYKRNTDSLVQVLKSIIAFANTAGGIILVGVEDNGQIVGVDHPGKIQEQLANSIANRIKPQLIPSFGVETVENKPVIILQIEHMQGPYYLNDKGPEKSVYIRMGNWGILSLATKTQVFEFSQCKQTVVQPYFRAETPNKFCLILFL